MHGYLVLVSLLKTLIMKLLSEKIMIQSDTGEVWLLTSVHVVCLQLSAVLFSLVNILHLVLLTTTKTTLYLSYAC